MSPVRVMRIPRSSGWFQPMTGVWHVTGDSRAADATASPSAASPSRSWRCWPGSRASRSGRRTRPSGGSGSASSHVHSLQVAETQRDRARGGDDRLHATAARSRARPPASIALPATATVRAAREALAAERVALALPPGKAARARTATGGRPHPERAAAHLRDGARRGRDRARQRCGERRIAPGSSRSPRSRPASCCSGRCSMLLRMLQRRAARGCRRQAGPPREGRRHRPPHRAAQSPHVRRRPRARPREGPRLPRHARPRRAQADERAPRPRGRRRAHPRRLRCRARCRSHGHRLPPRRRRVRRDPGRVRS